MKFSATIKELEKTIITLKGLNAANNKRFCRANYYVTIIQPLSDTNVTQKRKKTSNQS